MGDTSAESGVAPANAGRASGSRSAGSTDRSTLHVARTPMMDSNQSTSARGPVVVNCGAAIQITVARNSVTKALVEHVAMPFSKRSVVIAAALCSNRRYHAAHSLHLADTLANDRRTVVTLKCRTIAMGITRTVRSVHFLPPNTAFVERTLSRTNLAI